ncbi:hypothetical protein [Clostridium sp.]|uniref:hypothetical protein n=1 Tax=Clostridium sp. TaxID=1506 RepID=UPI00261D6A84|nr:hypothetical protein [Clostridium sp.]
MSYEDIQRVFKVEMEPGIIRSMISTLRDQEHMVILSKKRVGYKFIDLDQKQEVKILLDIIYQARKEINSAKKALRIYNKNLDKVTDYVYENLNEDFAEYLQEVKVACGFEGDTEDLVDTIESEREEVKFFLEELEGKENGKSK